MLAHFSGHRSVTQGFTISALNRNSVTVKFLSLQLNNLKFRFSSFVKSTQFKKNRVNYSKTNRERLF